jgi:hypothetical protein
MPDTTIGRASVPCTGSSTLLVLEETAVESVTLSGVPDGMVSSRTFGPGGGEGSGVDGGVVPVGDAGASADDAGGA